MVDYSFHFLLYAVEARIFSQGRRFTFLFLRSFSTTCRDAGGMFERGCFVEKLSLCIGVDLDCEVKELQSAEQSATAASRDSPP